VKENDTIFYMLIFPTAIFFTAVYTESLFLLLSLLTFYYSKERKYGLVGLFGFLASLTRITGLLLFIPILWEYWKNEKRIKLEMLPILFIPMGTLSFFVYHYYKFNDFLLFIKVQAVWGRTFSINREHFQLISTAATTNLFLDLFFFIFALVCIYGVFKRGWISYGIYMALSILVVISTGTLMSIGRYTLVLFPIYLLIASLKNTTFKKGYTMISILLLGLYITLFVGNYWAG